MTGSRLVGLVLASWVLAGSGGAQAQAIDDNLWNYPVEGLTLASTKADVDRVYRAKGWHDLSRLGIQARNNVIVDHIQYDWTRKSDAPEEAAADKDGGSLGRFQLVIRDKVSTGITINDNTGAPPMERAQALCAALVGKPGS